MSLAPSSDFNLGHTVRYTSTSKCAPEGGNVREEASEMRSSWQQRARLRAVTTDAE